jgi:hypothetical protein
LSALAAAALLAGCGSQAQVSPSGPTQNPAINAHGPIAGPAVKDHCTAHGGVRVDPCTIDFSASSPGPDSVTVRRPHDKKGTLSETDDCSSAGIATIALDTTTNTWTVTAGSNTGSCTATFDYANKRGKTVGSGDLNITNSI